MGRTAERDGEVGRTESRDGEGGGDGEDGGGTEWQNTAVTVGPGGPGPASTGHQKNNMAACVISPSPPLPPRDRLGREGGPRLAALLQRQPLWIGAEHVVVARETVTGLYIEGGVATGSRVGITRCDQRSQHLIVMRMPYL